MKYLLVLCILFIGCSHDAPEVKSKGIAKYCVHNGYATFQPCCRKMNVYNYGIKLSDCTDGIDTIYNPTNVTELK